MRRVVPRSLATRDLRDAAAHYADEVDAATARRFIESVERVFTRLARQPAIGSPRYAVELDLPGLRTQVVERFPYLVFYVERPDHIDVWRVLHARRDVPGGLQDPDQAGDVGGEPTERVR